MDNELEFDPLLVDCKLILSRSELIVDDGLTHGITVGLFVHSDGRSVDVGGYDVFRFQIGDVSDGETVDRDFKDKLRARIIRRRKC